MHLCGEAGRRTDWASRSYIDSGSPASRNLSSAVGEPGVPRAVALEAEDPIVQVVAEHHRRSFGACYLVGRRDAARAPGRDQPLRRRMGTCGAAREALSESASLFAETASWDHSVDETPGRKRL